MKTIRSLFNREDTAGIMFTLPFTLGFLFFMIVPMGISLYYSFCKYNILSPPVFTGLDNFKNMIADGTFFTDHQSYFLLCFCICSFKADLRFTGCNAPVKNTKMSGIYRAALLSAFHYRRFCSSRYPLEAYVRYGRCCK